jgi:hypothetical protein
MAGTSEHGLLQQGTGKLIPQCDKDFSFDRATFKVTGQQYN